MKNFKFKELIQGNKIYLKKHPLELAPTMYEYIDHDRDRLNRFMSWTDYSNSTEDQLSYIIATHVDWDRKNNFDYGIYLKNSDTYIGNIGAHTINWSANWGELGYWIFSKFEGKGYVSEAVKIMEEYLFLEGFNKVVICCSIENKRSMKIPKNLNYNLEGTLRDCHFIKGKYISDYIFSKLSGEFIKEKEEIIIRRARHDDAKGIIEAHIRSIKEICSKDYTQSQISEWGGRDFKEEIWHKSMDNDHVWVLDDGKKILGFSHLKILEDGSFEIMGLYFSPEITGIGFGKKIISKIKDFALEKNCKRMILLSTITAKSFYEKEGFSSTDKIKCISIGSGSIGCFPMEMTL